MNLGRRFSDSKMDWINHLPVCTTDRSKQGRIHRGSFVCVCVCVCGWVGPAGGGGGGVQWNPAFDSKFHFQGKVWISLINLEYFSLYFS